MLNKPSFPADQMLEIEPLPPSVVTPQSDSPVQVIDPALPEMSEESTPGTSQMQLLIVLGAVQTLPFWILADSGFVRNLIEESVFNRFSFKPPIKYPGDVRVIRGNGEALDLKGFAVLPVSLGSNLIWHEFGIMPTLPLEVLVSAYVLAPHLCSLLYQKNNKKRLQFGVQVCPRCAQHRTDPEVGQGIQLKLVDLRFKRKRNWLKVGYNFLATLPEAICGNFDCEHVEELDEDETPLVELEDLQLPQTNDPNSISPAAPVPLDALILNETSKPSTSIQSDQSGKLQRV